MEHESFENEYIAELMNQHFICIKVDREERPDVDQIYMEAVQMITGRGGWPLNVFCLPDGRPFFGGTYFPPDDRGYGIVPWPQLLMRISDYYQKNREELEENADNILKNIAHGNQPVDASDVPLQNDALLQAAKDILSQHDHEWGGFGKAPKFPPSMSLDFLLAIRATEAGESTTTLREGIDHAAQITLDKMARGGMYDQIGGGFARYSTDRQWIIPHFEKMLYDNALLISIYTKAWLRYRDPLYKAIVEETIAWLQREMLAPNGLFYSSLDADSEGEEGKFYVWTPDEVISVLGKENGKRFNKAYNITKKGNFEHNTSNPTLNYNKFEKRQSLQLARKKLLQHREQRIPPGKDTKQLLAWNSLLIKSLAQAGFYFNRKDWFELALHASDQIWEKMRNADGQLYAVLYPNGPAVTAHLDDYAYTISAFLEVASKSDWVKPNSSTTYSKRAEELMQHVFKHFRDPKQIGFFFTANYAEQLVARKKDWFDNAIPSGNSSMLHSLNILHAVTGNEIYAKELVDMRKAYPGLAKRAPGGVGHALSAFTQNAMGLAVIKANKITNLDALQKALAERPWRFAFIETTNIQDQAKGYQLCIGTTCLEPTTHPSEVVEKL